MKIAIAGVPKAGKTTLAEEIKFKKTLRTDDLIEMGWSEASLKASKWFDLEEFVIEGVAVPRALRKWLERNEGKPCDTLIWLDTEYVVLTPGQKTMAKGCITVFNEIKPELLKRGVKITDKWLKIEEKVEKMKPEGEISEGKPIKPIKKDVLTKRMKDFIIIFKKKAGRIYVSCKAANINPSTYYDWLSKSDKFRQEVELAKEELKDFVEGKIIGHINSEENRISADMVKFYAKTKMKDRGYVEKQEVELSGKIAIVVFTDEEIAAEVKRLTEQ